MNWVNEFQFGILMVGSTEKFFQYEELIMGTFHILGPGTCEDPEERVKDQLARLGIVGYALDIVFDAIQPCQPKPTCFAFWYAKLVDAGENWSVGINPDAQPMRRDSPAHAALLAVLQIRL